MKTCAQCGSAMSVDLFYRQPKSADGYMHICKECHKGRMNERRAIKLDEIRAYDRGRGQ